MAENKNSRARIAANNRYNAKAYHRINIAVPIKQKEKILAAAAQHGESVNAFINRLINEELERLQQLGGSFSFSDPENTDIKE